MKKHIAILGSTGSIGEQTLQVVKNHPELFEVEVLSAQNNCDRLINQAIAFQPNAVVIGNENCYEKVVHGLKDHPIKVFAGQDALSQIVSLESIDIVLNALVGYAGLKPTLRAIDEGKIIALANKESLVVAGQLVMEKAAKNRVLILPVDSEHSAIFQCLQGEQTRSVEKVYLTASGGPFRGMSKTELQHVTKKQALIHPNWKMGNKITIDSATLMNKGLEVIEAKWLFNLLPSQIEVIVHPQSIIHSMVQFHDGSIKAQLGLPDMKLPILYAMAFPSRLETEFQRFRFSDFPVFSFESPNREVFKSLDLALHALEIGGTMPCVLNAANEIAVQAFLDERIGFLDIPELIEKCMKLSTFAANPRLEDYMESNQETRVRAMELVETMSKF